MRLLENHRICGLICAAVLGACGGGTDSTTDAAGGGACGTPVTNPAAQIHKMSHAGPPPAMTGGTVVDGAYYLTAMDTYNGATGDSVHQEDWTFTSGTVTVLSTEPGMAEIRASGTYMMSGTTLNVALTCGVTATLANAYTATATQLVTVNQGDSNELHTFTKQ